MPYQIPPMPRPGLTFIQAYLQGLQARRDREEAEGRKEDREEKKRQTTLNFLLGIAKMTGKPGQVNKYIKENMPELGEIEMPQVGGTKKEVLTGKPTDVAAGGDIATKEIMEGGTTVSPGVKAKWDLADLMGLSEEQKKQYLTGIEPTKPSPIEQKLSIGLAAAMMPDTDPRKQIALGIAGIKAPAATSMWGRIFQLKPDITVPEIIKIRKQLATKPSTRSMSKLESYVRSIPGLKSKSPWALSPEDMDTVLKKMVKDAKWTFMSAMLWGQEGGLGGKPEGTPLEKNARLKELITIGETRDLNEEEEAELDALWAETGAIK